MEEIAFENGRISNFQGLVTLTLDWVILYTIVHHSSTVDMQGCHVSETSNVQYTILTASLVNELLPKDSSSR